MKKVFGLILISMLCFVLVLGGCGNAPANTITTEETVTAEETSAAEKTAATDEPIAEEPVEEPVEESAITETTMLVAAAASLEYSFTDELIPLFQVANKGITVEGTYDSSGKLQTQIEEGLHADVFISAATRQMDALVEQGLVDADSVVDLLENEIVLIAPADSNIDISSFEDIVKAETVALGDPESVPAGQYAQEVLSTLGVYGEVAEKASFGTNVTQVLNWVAEGSADVGIVYATDAATTDKVKILATAPKGSLAEKVMYPVGIVTVTENREAARAFVDFLQTPEAIAIFESYGFKSNI